MHQTATRNTPVTQVAVGLLGGRLFGGISSQRVRGLLLGFAVLALGAATGCNPNSIGRICINPQNSAPGGPQVISPALECPSRLCLIQPANTTSTNGDERKTCTAECESNDDCDAETLEYCATGFVCAVPTQVGNFCCKRLCVCKDDLVEGFNVRNQGTETEEIVTPHACDRSAPGAIVTCKNVPAAGAQ